MNASALVLGMAAVTFGVRYGSLALAGARPLPSRVQAALRYVAPAVLAAIIAPELLLHPQTGALHLTWGNSALVAGVTGGLVAWRTRHLLLTISVGMVAFALHRLWLGG